jgi:small subunit ribosomal protein S20
MPQHASAEKRVRQSERRRARNKALKTTMKTAVKRVRAAASKETAVVELKKAVAILDRLATKRIIHRNNAANQKSKLTRFVNTLKETSKTSSAETAQPSA